MEAFAIGDLTNLDVYNWWFNKIFIYIKKKNKARGLSINWGGLSTNWVVSIEADIRWNHPYIFPKFTIVSMLAC